MDNWKGMEQDPDAIDRIRRSCELLKAGEWMTVLDIGCYKQVARRFLPNCDYHGIDCERYVPDTVVRDLENGFLWDKKVDRILCLEVLEHLKHPSRVLESIKMALKDNGIVVISLPNENTLFHRIRALTGTCDAECFGERGKHLHLPSLKQCREYLGKYFEVVGEQYYISSTGSRNRSVAWLVAKLPKSISKKAMEICPSLFSRGFIFVCRKK